MRCNSWAFLLACTLASLSLGREPKARVTTIGIPTPKVGAHLGVWGSFPHILAHSQILESMKCDSLLAGTFASLCLGREPKVRVVTIDVLIIDSSSMNTSFSNISIPLFIFKFLFSLNYSIMNK
jgi:hypothetical protein